MSLRRLKAIAVALYGIGLGLALLSVALDAPDGLSATGYAMILLAGYDAVMLYYWLVRDK